MKLEDLRDCGFKRRQIESRNGRRCPDPPFSLDLGAL